MSFEWLIIEPTCRRCPGAQPIHCRDPVRLRSCTLSFQILYDRFVRSCAQSAEVLALHRRRCLEHSALCLHSHARRGIVFLRLSSDSDYCRCCGKIRSTFACDTVALWAHCGYEICKTTARLLPLSSQPRPRLMDRLVLCGRCGRHCCRDGGSSWSGLHVFQSCIHVGEQLIILDFWF